MWKTHTTKYEPNFKTKKITIQKKIVLINAYPNAINSMTFLMRPRVLSWRKCNRPFCRLQNRHNYPIIDVSRNENMLHNRVKIFPFKKRRGKKIWNERKKLLCQTTWKALQFLPSQLSSTNQFVRYANNWCAAKTSGKNGEERMSIKHTYVTADNKLCRGWRARRYT